MIATNRSVNDFLGGGPPTFVLGTAGDDRADRTVAIQAPAEALENRLAHEGTHVLAYHAWGQAGTILVGEGLAVWVSGRYAGRTLEEWRKRLAGGAPTVADLLARPRDFGEPVLYPMGGLLVGMLVRDFGIDAVRTHFLGATPATWADACRAAGTTPEAVEAALAALLQG